LTTKMCLSKWSQFKYLTNFTTSLLSMTLLAM
jgi:hypothetical protein